MRGCDTLDILSASVYLAAGGEADLSQAAELRADPDVLFSVVDMAKVRGNGDGGLGAFVPDACSSLLVRWSHLRDLA